MKSTAAFTKNEKSHSHPWEGFKSLVPAPRMKRSVTSQLQRSMRSPSLGSSQRHSARAVSYDANGWRVSVTLCGVLLGAPNWRLLNEMEDRKIGALIQC